MDAREIVIVCQVFYPDTQSTSQLLTDLLRGMGNGPLRFKVLTGYTAKEKGMYPQRREVLGNTEIRRIGIAIDYKKNLVRRGLHYFCYLAGSTIELWKLRKCSFVLGITNPPFAPVWLWLLSKLFLHRYQVMLQDIYPDGLSAVGKLAPNGWIASLWRKANRHAFQAADRVLVLGRDMGELVESAYGVPKERISCVPHWSTFTAKKTTPAAATQTIAKLGLKQKFIVQYSGNMGLWHDIESIVKAAAQLHAYEGIHFLMIGDGLRRAEAQRLSEDLNLRNITWLPFQPLENLGDSLSCCHVAIISQREGLKGVAVPCKLYGILASGRGIIAMVPGGSEIDLVVREECCGRTTIPGDVDGLVATILQLEKNRPLLQQMGENAFRAYQTKYTLDLAVRNYQEIWWQSLNESEEMIGKRRTLKPGAGLGL